MLIPVAITLMRLYRQGREFMRVNLRTEHWVSVSRDFLEIAPPFSALPLYGRQVFNVKEVISQRRSILIGNIGNVGNGLFCW